jgi:uncharacterized protein YgbK (DUF1537 family)
LATSCAEAERRASDVIHTVASARPSWIYLKFDSVLRGHAVLELRTVMATTGSRRALFVPANPSRRRVIRGGEYFVDGQPLHETTFAQDPEYPQINARVADLLGSEPGGISIPDAQSPADLAHHAAAADAGTLLAGAVDFFEALLDHRTPHPPHDEPDPADATGAIELAEGVTLLTCGSLTTWSERRKRAHERGVPIFELPVEPRLVVQALERQRVALLGIGDQRVNQRMAPLELVESLAGCVAGVFHHGHVDRLLLEGGATAAAVMRRLGWTRLRACRPPAPGVGAFTPYTPPISRLFIKPGSYPWPEGLW